MQAIKENGAPFGICKYVDDTGKVIRVEASTFDLFYTIFFMGFIGLLFFKFGDAAQAAFSWRFLFLIVGSLAFGILLLHAILGKVYVELQEGTLKTFRGILWIGECNVFLLVDIEVFQSRRLKRSTHNIDILFKNERASYRLVSGLPERRRLYYIQCLNELLKE